MDDENIAEHSQEIDPKVADKSLGSGGFNAS